VTESSTGKWEKCDCGTNRLNGMEQMDLHADSNTKKQIIGRIRDSVTVLVEIKSIPIKKQQVMSYVWNILDPLHN